MSARESAREAARTLVEGVLQQHRYFRAATIDETGRMSQEARRRIEDAVLGADPETGSEVLAHVFAVDTITPRSQLTASSLTRNLYSSSARFVTELIRNADDNHFNIASQQNEIPFLSFELHLHRKKIVVECNEDGFTRGNVLAISNIGPRFKRNSLNYMNGERIGFKSVFKVAYKVLIQSGDFTFSFKHMKGDSGMGMVCPDWEPYVSPLRQGLTRMTLFLHADENSEEWAHDIRDQFNNLHEEMLLFSKNLKKIEVRTYNEDDILDTTTTYQIFSNSLFSTSANRREIAVETKTRESSTCARKYFHVTRCPGTGIPRSNTRDSAQAKIVLAFPLTEDSVSLESNQSIFNFLPVCEAGFKVGDILPITLQPCIIS